MQKKTRKKTEARTKVDRDKKYELREAIDIVKDVAYAKFDETIDLAVRLGVNPKHADQMVRGTLVMPHGLGKEIKVLVFASPDKEQEAKDAGADFVGAEDLIEKIQEGWLDFDCTIAVPSMMPKVGKIGRILGTRGLMPNPKVGTVTTDVATAVKEAKAGKVEYRVEKAGIIHSPIGKVSFDTDKVMDNAMALLEALMKAKPAAEKSTYLKSIAVSSTMGPGIKVDAQQLQIMK